ncbi:unnamed protein product [Camellia sinensis]
MWHTLAAAMRRSLQNMKKSPRVADENMFGDGNRTELPIFAGRSGWNGFSVILSVVGAPFSLFSCLSQPRINGGDGVWVSGTHELARMSEINHLMVNDSMRYAILM